MWCRKNRARPEGSSAPAFIKMSRVGPVHMDPEFGVLFVPEPSTVLVWCMVVVKTLSLG